MAVPAAALAVLSMLTALSAQPARAEPGGHRTRAHASGMPASAGRSELASLTGVGLAAAGRLAAGPAATGTSRRTKAVSYLGRTFRVPRSWPVVRDGSHPHGCVRFDQHAVYLGTVGHDERCPSWLLGTTEALLIQPGPAIAARTSTENPVARQITAQAPGISVTATFDTDPTAIYRILASAKLPAPVLIAANPARLATASQHELAVAHGRSRRSPGLRTPMAAPALPVAVANFHGLGFDACAAPSPAYMRAWRHDSPYRAVGIYIGGADRACAQANLSAGWVRQEAQAGWHFIPLYAGPQAAFGELKAPASQGAAAASDAVAQAQRLGFGPRTPIYYDMEAYQPASRSSALRFLSAWTTGLHRLGYSSGVYSSSDSGVTDLARQYSSRSVAIPDVIYDALWNGAATTYDGHLRASQWAHQQRIHQFSGNVTQTFGQDTINIDKDYLNIRVASPGGTPQATTAVSLPGGSVDLFYRARGHRLWFERYAPGSGWSRPKRTGTDIWSVPSVVWTGRAVDVCYQGANGDLWVDSYLPAGRLTARRRLPVMGVLGSAPRAIAQPGGGIDVFWHGSADDHLWHGQFSPGSGWNGPQNLGGQLASAPSPVQSSPGKTEVFWKGADRSLWHVTRDLGGRWDGPVSLGMGPLGGAPQATAQPNGGVQIYWPGSGNAHLWEGFYTPRAGWRGPRDLGGTVQSAPWPVTAGGTVRVLWTGPRRELTVLRHLQRSGWNAVGWQGPLMLHVGQVASAPFAAVGSPDAAVRVFWRGRDGRLWTATLTGRGWTGPVRLAAAVS